MDQTTNDQLKSARMESDTAIQQRSELEQQIRRLQQQLERANVQNRTLQQENTRTNSQINETNQKNRKRIQELEEKLAILESELRKVEIDRNNMLSEHALLQKKLDGSVQDYKELQEEMKKLDKTKSKNGVADLQLQQQYQKQVSTLNESMRKQQTQLTRTKNLLSAVQEQRKHLQEDNMQLRAELDEYLKNSISNAAGITNGGNNSYNPNTNNNNMPRGPNDSELL